jgi:hypothetical protein
MIPLNCFAALLAVTAALVMTSCGAPAAGGPRVASGADSDRPHWFPPVNPDQLKNTKGIYFVPGLKGYQQTEEHTCGPAVLISLAAYYKVDGIALDKETEMRVAKEAGSRPMSVLKQGGKPGTKPDEMAAWLEEHGFDVTVEYEDKEDGSALRKLQSNLMRGIPTIVEWAELGGHWVIVVGYDTRGNDDPWDDVLILADPYDKYDDYQDGYTFVNANRFYWLWYDAFYFDKLTWRTMITATPKSKAGPGR